MKALLIFAASRCICVGPFQTAEDATDYALNNVEPLNTDDNSVAWAPVNYIPNTPSSQSEVTDILTSFVSSSTITADQEQSNETQNTANQAQAGQTAGPLSAA